MTSLRRRAFTVGGAALVLVPLQPVVVALVDVHQARENELLLAQGGLKEFVEGRVAVICFSRSGNTALMAQRIAQRMRARMVRLEARDYPLGLSGWGNAMSDAGEHDAAITPRTMNLSAYDTIYLGSPIWLYSPAPPIWKFVESNRFDNQHVVLFNTFNSRFKPESMEAFRLHVMKQGARSFDHRFVRRGRMGFQLSQEELLQAVDLMLEKQSPSRG